MTVPILDKIDEAAEIVRQRLKLKAPVETAMVTGSGLGALAGIGELLGEVSYADLPGLGASTVAGHSGKLLLLDCAGRPVFCLFGRRHFYEGILASDTVFSTRLMARLGVRRLLLTNAAGGIVRRLRPGDLMLIADHINMMFANPLTGPNADELGPRFPDMSDPFDSRLCGLLREAAREERVTMKEGVYLALSGPTYETKAEVNMLRIMGADAVGMSTVPEVLAAVHAGMKVAAVSLITNSHVHPADPPTHEEVLAMGREAGDRLARVFRRVIANI